MLTSDAIQKVCWELQEYEPDWQGIRERFESHPNHVKPVEFLYYDYVKYFSEIFLDLSLEDIAEYPDRNISFLPLTTKAEGEHILREDALEAWSNLDLPETRINELSTKVETENYRYQYDYNGRLFATKLEIKPGFKEPRCFKYDKMALIDDLPVDFEIKIAKPSHINPYLRKDNYERRLKPLRELFGTDVARAMIVPKTAHRTYSRIQKDHPDKEFERDGGILIPFYTDNHIFREHTIRMAKRFGYTVLSEELHKTRVYVGRQIKEDIQGDHSLIIHRNRSNHIKYSHKYSAHVNPEKDFKQAWDDSLLLDGKIKRAYCGISLDVAENIKQELELLNDKKMDQCQHLTNKRTLIRDTDNLLLNEDYLIPCTL
jgi:hypothetical protein